MDEKKLELFSKAWLFLGKKCCEKYGARAASMKVVPADKPEKKKDSA